MFWLRRDSQGSRARGLGDLWRDKRALVTDVKLCTAVIRQHIRRRGWHWLGLPSTWDGGRGRVDRTRMRADSRQASEARLWTALVCIPRGSPPRVRMRRGIPFRVSAAGLGFGPSAGDCGAAGMCHSRPDPIDWRSRVTVRPGRAEVCGVAEAWTWPPPG
jgi:hypothetical protein